MSAPPVCVAIVRQAGATQGFAGTDYESLIAAGDPDFDWRRVDDEWDAISLNYTSGPTGNPKGVVYHHRGAYLAAMSHAMAFNMTADTVYLWTLTMFHRSEEHTSELQSLMRNSYAVFCLKTKK